MNLGFKILKPFFFTPVKIGMLRYGARNLVRDECCNLCHTQIFHFSSLGQAFPSLYLTMAS